MESFIVYALIGATVTAAFAFLNKAASKITTVNNQGWYELRMNRLYQIIGLLVMFMAISFLYLLVDEKDMTAFATILILSLGFATLGLFCLLWYLNHKLNFNEKTISVSNFLGKSGSLKWNEITMISFSNLSGLISIMGVNGTKLKVHQHLVGLSSFVVSMEKKTQWSAKSLKLPVIKP